MKCKKTGQDFAAVREAAALRRGEAGPVPGALSGPAPNFMLS